jgi:two-component system response regulator
MGGAFPDSGVVARMVRTLTEAMEELRQTGYDAVLLRIERADQLSLVIQLKRAVPGIPVVALVPEKNSDLGPKARESGADEVVPAKPDDLPLSETDQLILRGRAVISKGKALRHRHAELTGRARALLAKSYDLQAIPLADLRILLVEDDADYRLLLRRTIRGLKLPTPLELDNGTEAIQYLARRGKYRDRAQYPDPTLVLLDAHLPRTSGFEVLQWIRSRPAPSPLIVFMLTSSPLPEDFDRAVRLGVDSYFVKPMSLEGLRNILQVAVTRWGYIYKSLHP